MKKTALFIAIFAFLHGCSTFRSYKDEQKPILESLAANSTTDALAKLEKNAPSERDLLFFLEKGEIQRIGKSFTESISTWTEADHMIETWENEAKVNMGKIGAAIGSTLINDKVLKYDGEDYEKVMLTTRQALNYLAAGQQDDAMVEMKKTWEREELIKQIHEKEIESAEEEAKSKGYKTEYSDLKGYPISTLNSPDVISLKNGYQNAFSQYLAGFIAESTGDIGNAAAGYRTAIELQPNIESLKQHLAELDARIAAKNKALSLPEEMSSSSAGFLFLIM